MTSRKMSFFDFWRRKRERGALLERANQLKLLPSHLTRLLGDSGARAVLQNNRMVSLLPPVGAEVFRRLTAASLEKIEHEAEKKDEKKDGESGTDKEIAEKDRPKPASDLEAGKPLPFVYGDPPPELLNTPLEDLDPFYQSQKTFVVLAKGSVLSKGSVLHRFNAESACHLLSPFNPLRSVAVKLVVHPLFSLFMALTILTNCVFMAMSPGPEWLSTADLVLTAIYFCEAIVKVTSRGFCVRSFTFLRDPWNWLDVMVIITTLLTDFVDLKKLAVLRTIPRILKIIPLIPGLRTTVGALVQSVKRLGGVVVLMLFCLGVLALIGLQLFMGTLRHKCVIWPINTTDTFTYDDQFVYEDRTTRHFDFSQYTANKTNHYFLPGQLDALLCGNTSGSGVCPEGFTCMKGGKNPNYGYTNFDSFGWSLLSVLRLMTQDFWDNLMMLTLRSSGKSYLIFFVLFVFPGSFLVLSLLLSVFIMASCDQEEAAAADAKQKEEAFRQIVAAVTKSEEEEEVSETNKKSCETTEESGGDRRTCPPCWSVLQCCGCWLWLQQKLHAVVTHPFFDLGIVICLVLNNIFLAMEHYPMTMEFEMHLSLSHLVFTGIFAVEMFLKVVAMGPRGYFKVGWNIFESIIVVLTLVELGLADFEGASLLRVIRLARWWPCFHMFLKMIWTLARALRNLTVLLLITVFFFTVLGMQLFRRDFNDCVCRIAEDCELPRWHMADFFHSFLAVVRVLFGEWIELLWDCMEVSGQATCLIFFLTLLVVGNLLVVNLFLTLLLSSFSSLEDPDKKEKNNAAVALSWIKSWILEHSSTLLGKKNHVDPDHTVVDSRKENRKEYLALNIVTEGQDLSSNHGNLTKAPIATAEIEFKTPENGEEEKKSEDDVKKHDEDDKGSTPEDCCSDKCYSCCPLLNVDSSQGSGRVWSNFRRACLCIVRHRYFDIFILVIIVMSSTALVFEDVYLQQQQVLKMVVETADQVFTYLFLLEMLLKWVAFGLRRYFSDAWCWLDFLVLDVFLTSLTANMLGFSELTAFQFLRTLRALGPLRAVSRLKGLKLVVQVLVRSVPSMVDTLLMSLTVWLIFSLAGVHTFAGTFFYCFNETSEEYFLSEDVNNKTECSELIMMNFTEVRWKNLKLNFDNVMNGFLLLLQMVMSADWMDPLYAAVDSRRVEDQPVYESNLYMSLFFILFFIIGSFFIFNFFIRVIINNMQFGGKHVFMTDEQQKSSEARKKRFCENRQKLPRPQNQCQARLFDLVTSLYFELFILVIICLNVATLMVETDNMSREKEFILYWFYFSFICVYLFEFILKVIALRKHYFKDGLNIVDFVVLVVCIVGLFLSDILEKYLVAPYFFPVLRLARICPVLRLTRCGRGIKKLLLAFMMSLPALRNLGLLFLLITFTFSVFGMFNFAYVKNGAGIDDMYNFETFWNSMICMIMTSPSSAWFGLLLPMLTTPPDCDPHIEHPGWPVRGDCGSPVTAIIFFATYICLSAVLILHMYVVVIVEILNSESTEGLCDKDLQMFHKTWKKFDPNGTQFIQYRELSDFCDALQDPLRIPKPNAIKLIHMDLPLFPGDKISCEDVFLSLAAQVSDDSGERGTLKARLEEKFMTNMLKVSHEPISSTLQRKQEEAAAKVIQRAYRKGIQQRGASGSAHPASDLD